MKTRIFLMLLFLSSIMYAQIPTYDLLSQYEFTNGTFTDSENNVTLSHTGTSLTNVNDRFGNASNAISLNGDHLSRANINGNNISYSFWVKTSTNTSDLKTIIDDSNKSSSTVNVFAQGNNYDTGYSIMLRDGKIVANTQIIYNTGGGTYGFALRTATSNFIADGGWHHVVVNFAVYNQPGYTNKFGRAVIHIDGSLIDEHSGSLPTTTALASFDNAGNMAIGHNGEETLDIDLRYTDVIDDVLIYNRQLTDVEILNIRNIGGFCFPPSTTFFSSDLVTDTSIKVVLNSSGTYELAYHKQSDPFSSATIITISNSDEATITGLMANTNYNFYLKSNTCSTWSVSKTFKTSGTIYVNHAATGNNDGTSWADAYTNLGIALANAGDNDAIWVASGVYKPHAVIRSATFDITNLGLKIYGGFAGTETAISQRVLGINETILSGDLQGNDVNVANFISNYSNTTRNADNSHHIINIRATGNNLLLDGLTISDAHTNVSASEQGGAILKEKTVAKLTLKNCIVKDNVSRNDNAALLAEFELDNLSGIRGKLIIENCQFINNMSRWATSIYSFVRSNTNVDITVVNTLFDKNVTGDLNTSSAKSISGSAGWFRMMGNTSNVNLKLINNTFVNNFDDGTGQSLNANSHAVLAISKSSGFDGVLNAEIANNIFWNNKTIGNVATRSITDLNKLPVTSVNIYNSIDEANFNDSSITSTTSISNSDPLFTSTTDFTLQSGSPAINAGDNSKIPTGITTDLAGNQRIFNTIVDMGAYEFDSVPLGVGNFNVFKNEVTIYPNPTSSVLNIKMDSNLKRATIYSILGKKVLETTSKNINTSKLNSGLYLIKIASENGSVATKKFMKK